MASPEVSPRSQPIKLLLLAAIVVWFSPNSQEITAQWRPALGDFASAHFLRWQPSLGFAVLTAFGLALGIMGISNASQFIYFNF
jgi:hypothetical protein